MRYLGIPAALAARGLAVEVVPGWETRGSDSFAPGGVTCHWTAGPRGTTGRPSLGVVTNGRSGLPGPLCNVYLARDGKAVVVAAGRANHAGAGGYRGLKGNSSVFGIEAECGGDGDWTPAMRVAYPKVVAALLSLIGRDASWAMGHNEWAPTRKIDIRDYTMAVMRQQVAAVLAGQPVPVSNPVPSTPAPANPWPLLKEGSRGPHVSQVQAFLGVPADGVFGPVTKAAVVAYQRALGLAADGIVGAQTWAAIAAGRRPAAPPPPKSSPRNAEQTKATQRALQGAAVDGFWGDDTELRVNLVRAALNGHFPGANGRGGAQGVKDAQWICYASADGIWGPKSAAALKATVKKLQAAWGVSADGVWGPKTEAAWAAARARNYKTW